MMIRYSYGQNNGQYYATNVKCSEHLSTHTSTVTTDANAIDCKPNATPSVKIKIRLLLKVSIPDN